METKWKTRTIRSKILVSKILFETFCSIQQSLGTNTILPGLLHQRVRLRITKTKLKTLR